MVFMIVLRYAAAAAAAAAATLALRYDTVDTQTLRHRHPKAAERAADEAILRQGGGEGKKESGVHVMLKVAHAVGRFKKGLGEEAPGSVAGGGGGSTAGSFTGSFRDGGSVRERAAPEEQPDLAPRPPSPGEVERRRLNALRRKFRLPVDRGPGAKPEAGRGH